MATLFESMWHGDIPSLPVLRDEDMGVMAVLTNPQETVGQVVVFPSRPVATYEDLTFREEEAMLVATSALAKHMRAALGVERVVRHVEGYGVPNHAHAVLLPSYQRGDSDRIHHPGQRLPFDEFTREYTATQERLKVPEKAIHAVLAERRSFFRGLIEDAT